MAEALRVEYCTSCNAPVWWVVTEAGKKMPVDHKPTEDGNIIFVNRMAHTLKADEAIEPGTKRWTSHFATCKNAKSHRKSKKTAGKTS